MPKDSDKEEPGDIPEEELTAKEEKFVRVWALTGNKSEAYRQAYDAKDMCPEAICVEACRLSKTPKIALSFKKLNKDAADLVGLTKARVLGELMLIGFSNIADVNSRDLGSLPESVQRAIKKKKERYDFSGGKDAEPKELVEIEMHDKLGAIEKINKMMGYNDPDRVELLGNKDHPLESNVTITPEQAYSIAIKGEVE